MSIDPASQVAVAPPQARDLQSLSIESDAVYAFDFDGVVSSSLEDDIYHLDTWPGERELLEKTATSFSLRCGAMATKYQRHLLYQACAFRLGLDIEPGPALAQVKEAAAQSRLFILAARSGWYAVERMRDFLKQQAIIPIEIFNIGRVTKDRQIDLLCREFSDRRVIYVEDNPAHLQGVATLCRDNLELVWVERESPKQSDLRDIVVARMRQAIAVGV